ncbi:MAG: polysaccharide biosynthesis tyrosine autokinase [candidate division KSB1 bacterium]|nr:polysaccharide biosynthesis tyrosine autokinase [candidate division KSB1 bacterium]
MQSQNATQNAQEWGVKDYLSLIIRRKWIILLVFLITFCGSTVYHFTRPPEYKASSTFTIESESAAGLAASNLIKEDASRSFGFYKTLTNSKIFENRVRNITNRDTLLLERMQLYPISFADLMDNLILRETEYKDLFSLSVVAFDPVVAYRFADIVVQEFKLRCQEIELEESRNIVSFVNSQLQEAEKNLEASERELQKFKERNNLNDMGQVEGGILKRLTDIENQLQEVQTERRLAQANYDSYKQRLRQSKNQNAPSAFNIESEQIRNVRQEIDRLEEQKRNYAEDGQFTSPEISAIDARLERKKNELRNAMLMARQNPEAFDINGENRSQIELLNEKIINAELNLFMLRNKERFLSDLLNKYKNEHPNLLEHTIKFAQLQRSKTVNENLYNYLIQKSEEAKIKAATGTGGISVVDAPNLPEKPISSNTMRNMMVAFILSFGLGFGVAFTFDYFDNSIYTIEDLRRLGNIPVFGTIPFISPEEIEKKSHAVTRQTFRRKNGRMNFEDRMNGYRDRIIQTIDAKSPIVDAYRQIRTNIQFTNVDDPIKRVMITSSIASEGKTLTTSNLGVSFAELGMRVLIIDADLRKPQQHIAFTIKRTPGLTDYLAKNIAVEKVTYLTRTPNLYLIPAGSNSPNPAELVASKKFSHTLDSLESKYDLIILDAPPIIPVTDPVLLAPKVKNILLVIKFGQTDWHVSRDAISRLQNVNVDVTGAILNGVKGGKGYGYYKYNYYSYQYSYYGERKKKRGKKRSLL